MKMNIRLLTVLTLSVFTTLTACKKEATPPKEEEVTTTQQMTTHSDDEARVSAEMDAVVNDANTVLESNTSFGGKFQSIESMICDATVTFDTVSNPRKITVTYDGSICSGNRTRTGVIVISMPAGVRWKDSAATVTVNYQNLRFSRLADNKGITINGTQVLKNVSGGRLMDLATRGSITHTLTSNNMAITFDDGTQRTWQVARKRVYTYSNGIVVTASGTHTEGTQTGITEWGVNRFGKAFSTAITQPLVVRQDCNFRLTAGQVQHIGTDGTVSVLFGLDSAGNATACPGTGKYYYKLSWTGNAGGSLQLVLPY